MKILSNRTPGYNNPSTRYGQWITYDNGDLEFDADFAQTTDILTAELYNGKAAKDDGGNWVPAPGPRKHELEFDIAGFHVGLTLIGFDGDGKAVHDYTVITPTGVAFHGDGKTNVLHTPTHWSDERVALEIVSWICLGEDSGATFADDLTPEQWAWIRSPQREMAESDISELIEVSDYGESIKRDEPVWDLEAEKEGRDDDILERAREMQERCIHANQTGLVTRLLREDSDYLSYDDIANLTPDVASMDAQQLKDFLEDEMGSDWESATGESWTKKIEEIVAEEDNDGEDTGDLGVSEYWQTPTDDEDLYGDEIARARDYINENHEPGEIFEWYLVDSFLADELEALGHPTLTDGSNHWWGRRTTGQYILMDGVLQAIAAKYI